MKFALILSALIFSFAAQASTENQVAGPAGEQLWRVFDCEGEAGKAQVVVNKDVASAISKTNISSGTRVISNFIKSTGPDLGILRDGKLEKLEFIAQFGNGYPSGVWRSESLDLDIGTDTSREFGGHKVIDVNVIVTDRASKKTIMRCQPAGTLAVRCC